MVCARQDHAPSDACVDCLREKYSDLLQSHASLCGKLEERDEKLRELALQVERLREDRHQMSEDLIRASLQNDRYGKALQDIASWPRPITDDEPSVDTLIDKAKAALTQKRNDVAASSCSCGFNALICQLHTPDGDTR